jgi:hypothetical protein
MTTRQPKWIYRTNLGDASPLDHGGYFIFEDATEVYAPEAEHYDPETGQAHRFSLERMVKYMGKLIPYSIYVQDPAGLPHPVLSYEEWFSEDIPSIASFVGMEPDALRALFTSPDILARAEGYRCLGEYWGWDNLDGYPLTLTRKEAKERYKLFT